MDDSRRPKRRSKTEKVSQAFLNYMHSRNYPSDLTINCSSTKEMDLNDVVNNEVSRSNSITYTFYSSDSKPIEIYFAKFLSWLNELHIKSKDYHDLNALVGPLFCHLYLELLQRTHKERPDTPKNFFKFHQPTVEKLNSDELIRKLMNAVMHESPDLQSLKKSFRAHKYCVDLSTQSVSVLKRYLSDHSHVVILQMVNTWFNIRELTGNESDEEDNVEETSNEESTVDAESDDCLNIIKAVKSGPTPVYTVDLGNLKDDATSGLIRTNLGLAIYSYSSQIFVTSLEALMQLPNCETEGDVVICEHSDTVYDFDQIGNHLLSASEDKTIKLFDLNDYSLVHTYKGHCYPVYSVSASPDGSYFVSGSYDRTCRLWSFENAKETLRLCAGHTESVTSTSFHPNARYFVSCSADRTVRMWTINEPCPVRLFLGNEGAIYASCFSNNGKLLATGTDEGKIHIWDLMLGKEVACITSGRSVVRHLIWSAKDDTLCSGSLDGFVDFWKVDEAICKSGMQVKASRSEFVGAVLLDVAYTSEIVNCLTAHCVPSQIS